MAYERTYWKDHVTDQDGNVIQEGTPMDQAHFNNMEEGITEAFLMALTALQNQRSLQDEVGALVNTVIDVTLTNTETYPFNNSLTTVALSGEDIRNTLDYTVQVEADGVSAGDFVITDKLVNGFKIAYTGSAASVSARCFIRGGV